MLLHIIVRNAQGEIDVDKIHNDAEARRVMDKAIEKGAEFTVSHHKAVFPPVHSQKAHDEAVIAADHSGQAKGRRAARAEHVAQLAKALGLDAKAGEEACFETIAQMHAALADEPDEPTKRGPGRPRKN